MANHKIYKVESQIFIEVEGLSYKYYFQAFDWYIRGGIVYIADQSLNHPKKTQCLVSEVLDINDNPVGSQSEVEQYLSALGKGLYDVSVKSSSSPPFAIYFSESLGPPTSLAADTAINDRDITLTDASLFPSGTWVGVFSGVSGEGRYYWGEVLNRVGNVITLDSPLDYAFVTGDVVLATNRNLAVDGSVTPRIFSVSVGSSGLEIDVTRLIYSMVCTNPIELSLFGDQPALTNGMLFRKKNEEYRNYNNIKTNYEMGTHVYDLTIYEQVKQQDVNALLARSTFGGPSKRGTVIRLKQGDELQIVVQDDLSGMIDVEVIAQGSEATI